MIAPSVIDKEGVSLTFENAFDCHFGISKPEPALASAVPSLVPIDDPDVKVRRLRVFISYSHKNEDMVRELKTHLSPHERAGLVEVWYDRDIIAGAEWAETLISICTKPT